VNLPFYIARRYLFSKKSHNIINIISGISVVGVAIGTLALIVVLSAFNGLERLVESLYDSFDPDIKITAVKGRSFSYEDFPAKELKALDITRYYTRVIEENALMKYDNKQCISTLKGVEEEFITMSGVKEMLIDGEFVLSNGQESYATVGLLIALNLDLNIHRLFEQLNVYVPKRGKKVITDPLQGFNSGQLLPVGVYSINSDFDDKYTIVPFEFVEELLGYDNEVTAVEMTLMEGVDHEDAKEQIAELLGTGYQVRTRYQQNEILYKTNKMEKWVTFLILAFILVIATFNTIGSLTMLVLDKEKDIYTLKSFGATSMLIRRIFFIEGMLINLLGGVIGLSLGGLLCWAQIRFGLVELEGGIVPAYPVEMHLADFLYILATVIGIGLLGSWYLARVLTKRYLQKR